MQVVDYKISKEFLENILLDNKKIIALFHANWSNFSQNMKEEFLKEEEDSYNNIKKIIIDIDKNGELVKKLGINQIPSLVTITKNSLRKNDFTINN
ncbi:thioredoxin domain-containing protein [Anaerococcus rubeinfantis]|uniref:thioredoxin domain-containing protein n=1 Tax=Anaerococcus rubeinfantis TaxID=1720199 RepID=UPI00073E855D|nr:thioredoxin domain-containing protein [Anaerococcus rubeinfantis]